MLKGTLCLSDVMAQLAICAVFHLLMGDVWSVDRFAARAGIGVPVSLILLAAWRWATGQRGWIAD